MLRSIQNVKLLKCVSLMLITAICVLFLVLRLVTPCSTRGEERVTSLKTSVWQAIWIRDV